MDLWSFAMRPLQVGGSESNTTRTPSSTDERYIQGEVEHRLEALGRDSPRHVQWSTNVLLMDHAIDQGDHAAKPSRQTPRVNVITDDLD